MSNAVAPQAWGFTIFCDDIRSEVGGKVALIGVYPSDMIVHVPFPLVMPKLGLWIQYFEVPGSIVGDGKLHVSLPGDEVPSIEADISFNELRPKTTLPVADNSEVDHWHSIKMPIVLSPVVLKEPGRILVRMQFDDLIISLGVLPVKAAPGNEAGY
jgi:hypothetical protein